MRNMVLLILVATLLGCGSGGKSPSESATALATNSTTQKLPASEADLEKLIKPGMPREALTAALGEPLAIIPEENGDACYIYHFGPPKDLSMRRAVVTGVSVYLTSNTVVKWLPSKTMMPGFPEASQSIPARSVNGPAGTTPMSEPMPLSFWILSDSPVEGGRFIDTPKFQKIGFISPQPNLSVSRLRRMGQSEQSIPNEKNEKTENYVLHLELLNDDAVAFERLCRENQGKKLLATVGDTPTLVATLRWIISDGKIDLFLNEKREFETIRTKLRELLLLE